MGLLDTIRSDDPRCQPLAYITDGERLCEVVEARQTDVIAKDCRDRTRWQISHVRLRERWRLVRAAPAAVPDALQEDACAG